MKIVETSKGKFKVFGEALLIEDKLAPAIYTVDCGQFEGFYLLHHDNFEITEKLYGHHEAKVDKIINSFNNFTRSMGVIFSGDKGLGKSIAAKLLCKKMVKNGYPVIMVQDNFDGLSNFIDSIQQECIVLFDEFDKVFRNQDKDGNITFESQENLLSLFDGTSSNIKRLYLLTCNDVINDLSDYLLNRPGRMHYHIRWDYPKENEIEEYLHDNLNEKYYNETEKVVKFSYRSRLNYDCLRAIAFELNLGISFEDAIKDINIINIESTPISITVIMNDGVVFSNNKIHIDSFSESKTSVWLRTDSKDNKYGCNEASLQFIPSEIIVKRDGSMYLSNGNYSLKLDDRDDTDITSEIKTISIESKFENERYSFNLRGE